MLDDLGREAMAAVAERSHVDILPDPPPSPDPVSVTLPQAMTGTVVDCAGGPIEIDAGAQVTVELLQSRAIGPRLASPYERVRSPSFGAP